MEGVQSRYTSRIGLSIHTSSTTFANEVTIRILLIGIEMACLRPRWRGQHDHTCEIEDGSVY